MTKIKVEIEIPDELIDNIANRFLMKFKEILISENFIKIESNIKADKNRFDSKNDLLSAKEASEYLKIKQSTLYFYNLKKIIPFYKYGKTIKYKISDLDKFIDNGRVSTNDELRTIARYEMRKIKK